MDDQDLECPLRFDTKDTLCIRDRCAWWIAYAWNVGACAIKHLAERVK